MFTFFNRIAVTTLLALLAIETASASKPAPSAFGKVDRITVGGTGGWDLLAFQPAGQHLFISRSDRVQVFDSMSGKLIKEISGTSGVHGIAVADNLGLGFTSNGKTNSVTVFDLASLNVMDEIKGTGENPDAILYDPKSKRVFAFNGRSQNASVIDAVTKSIISTIALPGKPELPVLDGKGHIFVNLEDKNSIAKIDIGSLAVTATWVMDACEGPTGLAMDTKHDRLFSVCNNHKMVVVNAVSGKTVGEVAIGGGPDGVVFDAKRALIVSSNGEGSLSVIHEEAPGRYKPVATITTLRGARTIALDESHHIVYLVTSEFGPPPAATAEQPHPRPSQIAGTFSVLVVNLNGTY